MTARPVPRRTSAGASEGPSGPESQLAQRSDHPFDAGLQPERTALAWQRTALTLLGASVVAARMLLDAFGAWALVTVGPGVLMALTIAVASRFRYREQHSRLTSDDTDRVPLPDGALPALIVSLTIAGGLAALALGLDRVTP